MTITSRHSLRTAIAILAVLAGAFAMGGASASAATRWEPRMTHYPTHFEPGGTGTLVFYLHNAGDTDSGDPATMQIELPAGLTATAVVDPGGTPLTGEPGWSCSSLPATSVTCTLPWSVPAGSDYSGSSSSTPFRLAVDVNPSATGTVTPAVSVSSAGSAEAETGEPIAISGAPVEYGVQDFDGSATRNVAGDPEFRAGAHPFEVTTSLRLNMRADGLAPDRIRTAKVSVPLGFVGNPTVVDACTTVQLASGAQGECPINSQVGVTTIADEKGKEFTRQPVFLIDPPPGYAAMFGFRVVEGTGLLLAKLRPDDYGIEIVGLQLDQAIVVSRADFTIWGAPADPVHDTKRGVTPDNTCFNINYTRSSYPGTPACSTSSTGQQLPFLTLSTSCTEPGVGVETKIAVAGWESPDVFDHASFFSHLPPGYPFPGPQQGTEECDSLEFDPLDVKISPDTRAADAPTGLEFGLRFAQTGLESLSGRSQAHLKRAEVRLPEGLTINPGAAGGLDACTDEQLALGQDRPVSCPAASKVGTVTATTPLLEETLEGSVYIRSQASMDPESGDLFRLALNIVNRARGVDVKLPGRVIADEQTGQLTAVFDNNPQLPVGDIQLRLKNGPRAPLATPAACGERAINANFDSWGGQFAPRISRFNIDCRPGLGDFAPGFDAGTTDTRAGGATGFVLDVDKADGQSPLDGLRLEMPTGLLAKVKGNLGTQVGTVQASAGPGSSPFTLPGKVFFEGPYGDAPYSLRVVVPAKAGPFDLGDVVVRQKVYVDPNTAQVRVVSDPVPTIVKGVPVRLQHLHVDVDKPGFMRNPSSCSAKTVSGVLGASTGQTAPVSARFQAADCAALPFKPRLALALTGKKQTRTGQHPGVNAVVRQKGTGEAGIEQAKVTLPKSLALDPDNAQALCEFADGTKPDLENHCPKGSIVGRAKAVTPLLERPLTGNVYFVKNVRRSASGNLIRTLPMLVVALRGEIAINLKGASSTAKDGRLVNTFASVPDAPISQFNLNVKGGSSGILAVTRTRKAKINLCAKPKSHVAETDMDGHNGKRYDSDVRVKAPCAAKKKPARRKASKR